MSSKKAATFQWTDEEWAILEPLTQEQRFMLCMTAMMQGRSLLSQAKHDGLMRDGGVADTPGS